MIIETQIIPGACLTHSDGTVQVTRSVLSIQRDINGRIVKTEKVRTIALPKLYRVGEVISRYEVSTGPVIYKEDGLPYKLIELTKEKEEV